MINIVYTQYHWVSENGSVNISLAQEEARHMLFYMIYHIHISYVEIVPHTLCYHYTI